MTYRADDDRYDRMHYRRCGRSGLKLPVLALGLWQNFGDDRISSSRREILRFAFDHGMTHFDLANNYGPPPGAAEAFFGEMMRRDFRPYRDEVVISTKAGYGMWPGPYGEWGSRKYLIASVDQSLSRLGVEYVDIFYSHRFDPETPLDETMAALDAIVRSGKALYVGLSSYSPAHTIEAMQILDELGTPAIVHQPSYSMLNRWIEKDLLQLAGETGFGLVLFSVLAQGLLTDKYLGGIPEGSRASRGDTLSAQHLDEDRLRKVRGLNEIASARGQSLAQMAISWALRDPRTTSAVIGASSVEQLRDSLKALSNLDFTEDELRAIEQYATESGVDRWRASRAP